LAHTLHSSVFMSYPWERSLKTGEIIEHAVISRADLLATELAPHVAQPSKTAIVGIGHNAILGSAIISQRLSVRAVYGLDIEAPKAAQSIVNSLRETQDVILVTDSPSEKEDFIRCLGSLSSMHVVPVDIRS